MDAALERLSGMLEPGDVLLTIGAGDVNRLAEGWLRGGP
jgi:UDP-N-acetylmuramate-alanine ligase